MTKRIGIMSLMIVTSIGMGWQNNTLFASTPGRPSSPLPIAPKEAAEKLKHAEAALKQGQAELAYRLAYEVYQKYGNVRAAWYPSWVYRKAKGQLPDPNDRDAVIGAVVQGHDLPLNLLQEGTFTGGVLFNASWALANFEEVVKWGAMLIKAGNESYSVHKKVEIARGQLARGWAYRPRPKPSRENWRPLSLQMREEDYFVVVPLDEASQVLGLSHSITPNPTMAGGKGIRVTAPHAPHVAWRLFLGRPQIQRLENGKGQTEYLSYAPFEENGKVWVPFYWLAQQARIGGWEVRNGKIYVAPREGSGQGTVPSQKTTTAGSR